jgi:hypothetical protein
MVRPTNADFGQRGEEFPLTEHLRAVIKMCHRQHPHLPSKKTDQGDAHHSFESYQQQNNLQPHRFSRQMGLLLCPHRPHSRTGIYCFSLSLRPWTPLSHGPAGRVPPPCPCRRTPSVCTYRHAIQPLAPLVSARARRYFQRVAGLYVRP